ncbi:MAG: AAA family ATPase [Microbacteriaceae bacterium]
MSKLSRGVTLSPEQSAIYDQIEGTSQHIFVTGRAGTGKSTLLTHFMSKTSKRVAVVAPTGVAALLVGGQTIHSFFRLPIGIIADHALFQPEELRAVLRSLDTLVIDEVSMVNADVMDAINRSLKRAKRSSLPFGGVQLLMFGDPYQLAPVPPRGSSEKAWFDDNYSSQWFFDAKVWEEVELLCYELREIHRQSDDAFKALLNAVRHGHVTASQANVLNTAGAREVPEPSPIVLASTNAIVEKINRRELELLPGDPVLAVADIEGKFDEKHAPADVELKLKVGAQVMFLRNDPDQRWVNGTLGIVTAIAGNVYVEVDGEEHEVTATSWERMEYNYEPSTKELSREVVGEFVQFPLRLAWAVTIHKSQGQSYDSAVIDLGHGAFSPGQSYVALSRIRSLEGLYLSRPLRPSDVIVDARVAEFMESALGRA